jgi:hypothetical protein
MDATEDRSFACVGEGILDFPSIFKEALQQNIQHYIVEKDKAQNGMHCLQVSADYLKSLSL